MDIHNAIEGGLNHASTSTHQQQDPNRYVSGRDDALQEAADDGADQLHGFSNLI
jgi:hypothetical protein